VANITSSDQELLTTLVQRSLGLLSEVHEIEKRLRQLYADLSINGVSESQASPKMLNADPVNRGSMRWNHRQ
jgi:hypothetical protein